MKQFQLQIEGRIPSKKNSRRIFTRNGRTLSIPSKKHKEWHEWASWQLFTQKKKVDVQECDIEIEFYPPDKRKYDLTNKAESIMDLLVDAGIIKDDNAEVVKELKLKAMPQSLQFVGAKVNVNYYA